MRHLTTVFLVILLLSPWGCGSKPADPAKSPDQSAATDSKSPENPTASQPQAPPAPETSAESVTDTKTPEPTESQSPPKKAEPPAKPETPTEPVADVPKDSDPSDIAPKSNDQQLPAEFAAFSYIPGQAAVLISTRPSAIVKNELVQTFPNIDKPFSSVEALFGPVVQARDLELERFTIAFWHGKGHAYPGGWFEPAPPKISVPQLDEPQDDCAAQLEDEFDPFFGLLKVDFITILQFHKPFDLKRSEVGSGKVKEVTRNGITYHTDVDTGYYMPNPTTLLMGPIGDLEAALDNKTPAKIVRTALDKGLNHEAALVVDLASLRPLLKWAALIADEQLMGLAELPDQLETLFAHLDLNAEVNLNLVVDANAEAAPKTLQTAFNLGYGLLGQLLPNVSNELKRELGEELGIETSKFLNEIHTSTKGEADGKQFKVKLRVPQTVKGLYPKIVARQMERCQELAKKNQLKNIGIAAHIYHDTFKMFPFPNGRSDAPQAEKDKLSWRVHLLPYLDQHDLYKKFHLDEAWDSEHNKALLEQMPDDYKLSEDAKPGHTQYVAPAGKGFIVDGNEVRRFSDILDGASQTMMVLTVKADKAVPWTKPGGFELDPEKAAPILGGDPKGFLALFCDGTERTLDPQMPAQSLKALLTISGGEAMDASVFETGNR